MRYVGAVGTSEGTLTLTFGLLIVWLVGILTIRRARRYRGSESSILILSTGTGNGIGGTAVKGALYVSVLIAGRRWSSYRMAERRNADGDGCGEVTELVGKG